MNGCRMKEMKVFKLLSNWMENMGNKVKMAPLNVFSDPNSRICGYITLYGEWLAPSTVKAMIKLRI